MWGVWDDLVYPFCDTLQVDGFNGREWRADDLRNLGDDALQFLVWVTVSVSIPEYDRGGDDALDDAPWSVKELSDSELFTGLGPNYEMAKIRYVCIPKWVCGWIIERERCIWAVDVKLCSAVK